MNQWLQTLDWEWIPVALVAWSIILGAVAWLLSDLTTRPPRHH